MAGVTVQIVHHLDLRRREGLGNFSLIVSSTRMVRRSSRHSLLGGAWSIIRTVKPGAAA